MDQDRLWAPWRLGYIKGTEQDQPAPPEPTSWLEGADKDCFLCRAAADYDQSEEADRALYVIERDELSVVLLNRYPYANGHLLVSPRRHVASLSDLTDDELLVLTQQIRRMTERLKERFNAHGFNVGLNLGQVAGAGVPGHLHWHIVPRWPGDQNYMPVTAGIRVLPQSLDEAWAGLRE